MEKENFPDGTRYQDAHLARIDLDSEMLGRMNTWMKSPRGLLLFIGNPGVGKTYFCAAMVNHFRELGKKCFYKSESEFLRCIRNSISEPGGDYSYKVQVMARYEALWILDDIGTSQMTEWQKEVLLMFVNELYEQRRPAIITSNVWLKDINSIFSHRFRSRLAATENTIIELNAQDKRQLGM